MAADDGTLSKALRESFSAASIAKAIGKPSPFGTYIGAKMPTSTGNATGSMRSPSGEKTVAVRVGTAPNGDAIFEYHDNVAAVQIEEGALKIVIVHNDCQSVECYAEDHWERYTVKHPFAIPEPVMAELADDEVDAFVQALSSVPQNFLISPPNYFHADLNIGVLTKKAAKKR